MKKVFIDGSAGTTGLRIYDRLSERSDIELMILSDEKRKNPDYRKEYLNKADIAFLCLPDSAADEAVSFIENDTCVVIDTSTIHRVDSEFTYGFPELSSSIEKELETSNRIAVPGCHASGFIALIRPLVENGFIDPDVHLSCHSLTGYSGGGKKMIAQYEDTERISLLDSPRQYGIAQNHKHLREMVSISGLSFAPAFCPIVADYYSGMLVTVPIFSDYLKSGRTSDDVKKLYKETYNSSVVFYTDDYGEEGFMASNAMSGLDSMQITVSGNSERMLLCARYDNLGKGASGAALQCMNIRMGLPADYRLTLNK